MKYSPRTCESQNMDMKVIRVYDDWEILGARRKVGLTRGKALVKLGKLIEKGNFYRPGSNILIH